VGRLQVVGDLVAPGTRRPGASSGLGRLEAQGEESRVKHRLARRRCRLRLVAASLSLSLSLPSRKSA
jgi:hypothetical protein